MAQAKYTIGIDLGGTKVAAALVDAKGLVVSDVRRPTVPPALHEQDPRHAELKPTRKQVAAHIAYVVEAIAESALEVMGDVALSRVHGIGLASAGPMNLHHGTLDYPSNFKGWGIVPLVKLLAAELKKRKFRKPIYFQNDAMAAALGEGWTGRAGGCETYAMITVGTGIGSGVILNGQPSQSRGMGSEWGHMLVDARGLGKSLTDYDPRTVEGLASGTGLVRCARAKGHEVANVAEIAEAARAGHKWARELFEEASEALAALFYSLSLGYNLDKIVVSGGMLAIRDCFLPHATDVYKKMMKTKYPEFLAPVQIAQLGTKAGVIGAARLPWLDAEPIA